MNTIMWCSMGGLLVLGGLLVFGLVRYLSWYRRWFGPGQTMAETADILVWDEKFGSRAIQKAIAHGDAIIPLIQQESHNFQILRERNAPWIAEVLGAIPTDTAYAMLWDVYTRPNRDARVVGAAGLVWQGRESDREALLSFLVTTVQETSIALAIDALGHLKDPRALPCLCAVVQDQPTGYSSHATACEALARIGDPAAIPVLQTCLQSPTFYALPEAFRALITLGDRTAVPLAIARISPECKGYASGRVVYALRRVTGQWYGYDRTKWERWWQSVATTWQIPARFTRPWDDQPGRW